MSMFKNLNNDGLEEVTDRLGGFKVFDTDAYPAKIKLAYGIKSSGGASGIAFVFDLEGSEYKETVYVTNKKGENFFLNKDDNSKKVPLPGFVVADHICLVASGKPLCEQDTEDKVVNIWDSEAKKEMPSTVPMLLDLLGKYVMLGIQNSLVFIQKKVDGVYVVTDEKRNENNIEKIFDFETKMTVPEALAEKTEAAFYAGWVERNKGKVRDKTGDKAGAKPGAKPGAASPAAGAAPKRTSLFGPKS